jgi:hypothetical protein
LERGGIKTIGDLLSLTNLEELNSLPNVGAKSIAEVRQALAKVTVLESADSQPEAVDQKFENQPPTITLNQVIDWQASLIERHINVGLLHPQAQYLSLTVAEWLEAIGEPKEVYEALKRYSQ